MQTSPCSPPATVKPTLILFAHPHPNRSRMNRPLLEAVRDLPGVRVHDLYERYPDFYVRVEEEQEALRQAELIIFQYPFYWYSAPGLLKHWQDVVLDRGFAYGSGSYELAGKQLLLVVTAGHNENAYCAQGQDRYTMDQLLRPFERMAMHCRMRYLEPLLFYGARRLTPEQVAAAAARYRERIQGLLAEETVGG